LLSDTGGRPGDDIPDGTFSALTVPAGLQRWATLCLAQPLATGEILGPAPSPGAETSGSSVAAWLELQLSDGEIECSLTRSPVTEARAPGAPLRRRLPGGGTSPLTVIEGFEPLNLAFRLAGRPGPAGLLPAVGLGVASGPLPAGEPPAAVGIDPGADDIAVAIPMDPPLPTTGSTLLTAVVNAAGSLTLDTVRVLYAEAGTA
jgi:hypothetical protein